MPPASKRIVPLIASSEFGQREVADAAVGDRRAAGEHRLRAADRRSPRSARRGPSRGRRGRTPAGCRGSRRRRPAARSARRAGRSLPDTRSRVSSPTSCSSSTRTCCSIERDPDRRGVLHGVVEQPHVERVDRAVDEQVIDVGRARPTTRIDPLATAVVNGDSLGTNSRTYGSSELSWKRNVSSASACGVSAMRPVPVIARRGDAASIVAAQLVAAQRQRAGHLADAFLADEQIVDAELARRCAARRTCRCRWR